ncbi:helix-turn-helix transcriptional regulator [Bacillus luteolus]|uniref:Helix-turn-helix transcriptional regulator n=1 Tax=Litchfieldia luteola TaxID=682179 RepID=A0ABR9QEV0_9BACI|nr:helix-turn-helix domain-containing protein [Cytobacillus luteolus]MBE4907017.1 helix-turn-helix transcriptional regulator [Cytobacillus luteolus]MBP1943516.1 DNA-binding transcriptional ArsR family regulator [Cytobacillus luteolus]
MASSKKITDIELAKILMDPRRRNIFDIAKDEPVTVTQIAEALNEKPSRLYYHVKKLEDAGLLELVETRQQGNLIEKYYKSVSGFDAFELDKSLLAEHSDTVMAEVMRLLEPGLRLLSSELKNNKDSYEKQVSLSINFSDLTGKEWLEANSNMVYAIRDKAEVKKDIAEEMGNQFSMTKEELEKKSKYTFLVLSYKNDDAENLE